MDYKQIIREEIYRRYVEELNPEVEKVLGSIINFIDNLNENKNICTSCVHYCHGKGCEFSNNTYKKEKQGNVLVKCSGYYSKIQFVSYEKVK